MVNSKALAAVIVSYKNENETIDFIKNELLRQLNDSIVIIVNNGASHESSSKLAISLNAQLIEKKEDYASVEKKIFVLHSSENLGFAKGNNLGASFLKKYFNVKYILFSNTDIHFKSPNVVSELISKIAENFKIGVIGPDVRGLKGERQSPESYRSFWDQYVTKSLGHVILPKALWRKKMKLDYTDNAQEGFVDKVMGSFFVVDAKSFFECGMMDPHTFLYYEELILTERMKKIGKGVYFFPKVSIIHEHGVTIKKFNSMVKMEKINLESGCYYYHNYRGESSFKIFLGKTLYLIFFYAISLKMRLFSK